MNIGENIKKIREGKKISQEQLSNISGVPRTSLGRYERGERTPNIGIIKKIADALGVPLFLLTGESKISIFPDGSVVEVKPENVIEVLNKKYTKDDDIKELIDLLEKVLLGFEELESNFNKFKKDYAIGAREMLKLYKEGEE